MIEDHALRAELLQTNLAQIPFADDRLPGVSNLEEAILAFISGMYPSYIDTVDTPADLPVSANDGDYYIVSDSLNDGSNVSAGYVWETRDGVSGFNQKYSWNAAGILTDLYNQIDPEYVSLLGKSGGQQIAGGRDENDDLHLEANSFDDSGNIIIHNNLLPFGDNEENLGSLLKRFVDIFIAGKLKDGTVEVSVAEAKTAYDHSQLTGNPHTTSYENLTSQIGTLTINGDVSTVNVDFSTSGNKSVTITITDDSHNHTSSTITDFSDATWTIIKAALVDTTDGQWTFNDGAKTASLAVDIDTNNITDIASPSVNKVLAANSSGDEWEAVNGDHSLSGDVSGSGNYNSATQQFEISTTIDNTPIRTVDLIDIENYSFTTDVANPVQITLANHGLTASRNVRIFNSVELDGEHTVQVVDANTLEIAIETTEVNTGYLIPDSSQLLYNSNLNKYMVRLENSELSHHELQNKDADDHAQYALLDGRGTSQTLSGGNLANGQLILQSTSDRANTGEILHPDTLAPQTGATYSGGWSGVDLGTVSRPYRHLYVRGELKGGRIEQVSSLPTASAQDVGKMVQLPSGKIYVNQDGVNWKEYVLAPSYTGNAGKSLVVNSSEDGFEYKTFSSASSKTVITSSASNVSIGTTLDDTITYGAFVEYVIEKPSQIFQVGKLFIKQDDNETRIEVLEQTGDLGITFNYGTSGDSYWVTYSNDEAVEGTMRYTVTEFSI
tara:strand:+ start:42471 stop:44645 length:2175 start_codon:yes stop_codon:yes gene_type:complete